MGKIIRILMRREELTREEASEMVQETMEEVHNLIEMGDYEEAEWVFEHELGLECDYLLDALI